MVLVDVDSGVVRFACLLQIVCHERFLSVDDEAPRTVCRRCGVAACALRCATRAGWNAERSSRLRQCRPVGRRPPSCSCGASWLPCRWLVQCMCLPAAPKRFEQDINDFAPRFYAPRNAVRCRRGDAASSAAAFSCVAAFSCPNRKRSQARQRSQKVAPSGRRAEQRTGSMRKGPRQRHEGGRIPTGCDYPSSGFGRGLAERGRNCRATVGLVATSTVRRAGNAE